MCGIAGYAILEAEKKPADRSLERLAASLLVGIDDRGGDATGAGCFGPNVADVVRASCRAHGFLSEWRGIPEGTSAVLLHTRWATQGKAAFPENNHPVSSGPVYVVHNGHITNDAAIFAKTGKARIGRVDSEAIPASLLNAGWQTPNAGLERLTGAFAIAAVHTGHPGEVLLAKSGWSPLVYVTNGRILVWASEALAIEQAWRDAFGGKAPHDKRYLTSGDLLRIAGSQLTEGRFRSSEPAQYAWAYAWDEDDLEPAKTAKQGVVKRVLSSVQPVSKSQLARELDDGNLYRWNADDLLDRVPVDDLDEIRCACCDDWTAVLAAETMFGEMVCPACAHELRLDTESLQ